MTVLIESSEEEYRQVAEYVAADRNESLVSDLSEAESGEVLYVTSPEYVRLNTILRLQERLKERGPSEGAYGIITGYTPESAKALYERRSREVDCHWLIPQDPDVDRDSSDESARIYPFSELDEELAAQLRDEPSSSISGRFPGWTIHVRLADTYLCGIPTVHDVNDFEGPLPDCVNEEGRPDCPLADEDDLVHADQLDSDHVFLNACTKTVSGHSQPFEDNPGGDFPVHVGMGILENAVSLIGGFRPMRLERGEVVLHYALLHSGYTSMERCYLLNCYSERLDNKLMPYILFGRPDSRIPDPEPQRYDWEVVESEDRTQLRVTDVDSFVVDVRVPADRLDVFPRYVENAADERLDSTTYYTSFRDGDDVRILLFSASRIQADELRFDLSHRGKGSDEYRILMASQNNLRQLHQLGLLDGSEKRALDNVRNRTYQSETYARRRRFDVDGFRELTDWLDEALAAVRSLREDVLDTLTSEHHVQFARQYQERLSEADVWSADRTCHNCGRPLFVEEEVHPMGEPRRVQGICPKCVNVFDAPVTDDGGFSYPVVHSDLTFDAPTETTFEVSFENPTDEPMDALFYPNLISIYDDVRGNHWFDPGQREVYIPPNGQTTVTFDADFTSLRTHHNPLKMFVVGNMNVYVSTTHVDVESW